MTRVAVFGVGRMGAGIIKKLTESGSSVVAAFAADGDGNVGKDAGELAGIGELGVTVEPASKIKAVLAETKPEVAVDFTIADACVENVKLAAEAGLDLVIGTTGFSEQQLEDLNQSINSAGVGAVISPNMSAGVNVFWNLCVGAAKALKGYEIKIVDAHHVHKKDNPSGTAKRAAAFIAEAAGISRDDVEVVSVREGEIVGEHTVTFTSPNETLEVKHTAHSRDVFIDGVVKAVEWVNGKKGTYSMKDVLGL